MNNEMSVYTWDNTLFRDKLYSHFVAIAETKEEAITLICRLRENQMIRNGTNPESLNMYSFAPKELRGWLEKAEPEISNLYGFSFIYIDE